MSSFPDLVQLVHDDGDQVHVHCNSLNAEERSDQRQVQTPASTPVRQRAGTPTASFLLAAAMFMSSFCYLNPSSALRGVSIATFRPCAPAARSVCADRARYACGNEAVLEIRLYLRVVGPAPVSAGTGA
jgi:hypothetical protein